MTSQFSISVSLQVPKVVKKPKPPPVEVDFANVPFLGV